jgi:16S rRNA processing protein RimM
LNSDTFIAIGAVLKPHGIHGELRVRGLSSFPERFQALKEVYLRLGGRCEAFAVEGVRPHKEFLLVKLKGIQTMNEAEAWRNADLVVPPDQVWAHGPDFHFYHELIGLRVYLPRGEFLGHVTAFDESPGTPNMLVESESGKEYAVPFVKDFVTVVKGEKVIVRPIPGLLADHED